MTEAAIVKGRILVIDDNPAIHDDFRKILCPPVQTADEFEAAAFGIAENVPQSSYEVDFASQGKEGFEKVQQALAENRPYHTAFIDVRMPPGWDGVETASQIWQVQPGLPVVICTAYSDYTWDQLFTRLGHSDRLIVLKKPFENIEVLQLASTLTKKWQLESQNGQAHERRYKGIFDDSPDGIYQMDARGRFVDANPAWAKILGCASRADLLGSPKKVFQEYCVNPKEAEEFLRRLDTEPVVREFESEVKCCDGSRKWLSQTGYMVTNSDGSFLHYQAFATDITAKRAKG